MTRVDQARIDRLIRAYALIDTTTRRFSDPRVQRLTAAMDAVRAQMSDDEAAAYWRALQAYWRERRHQTWG